MLLQAESSIVVNTLANKLFVMLCIVRTYLFLIQCKFIEILPKTEFTVSMIELKQFHKSML